MKGITRFLAILFVCLSPVLCVAQPVNSVIGDVQPASPEVAALARFSEIPVSTFTGAASVSIPIHVLREGLLEVPISLNHHNGGVRVGETASWIGLGWSMSGGGVISRTILGLPDNNSQGILNQNTDYSHPLTRSEVGEGSVDGEPDLFSFHFPGGSGKFIFDGDHLTVLQFPYSNMRITVDSEDLNEFVITTTDGTRYIFGSITSSDYHGFIQTASEQSTASAILRSTGRSRTEWYLRRIESFDGRYAIAYTYRDETYTAIAPSSQEWSEIYGAGPTGGFEGDRDYRGNFQVLQNIQGRTDEGVYGTVSQYEVKKCATITTSTTKVTFVKGDSGYWTLRLFDIGCPDDGGDPWLGRAFIEIEDASNPSNYSELLEFESTITDSITFAIDSLFPGLDTSTTYNITVTSVLGLAEVEYRQAKIIQTNVETDVGGLRLKRSLVYNSDGSLAREKRYRYTQPGDTLKSTGILYIEPDFGAVINVSDTFGFATFLKFQWTSTPSLPLTDLNGSHIGYQYVQEEETATGAYSLYRHRITGPDLSSLEYPLEPLEDNYDRGKLRSVLKGSTQKVVERSLHGGAEYDGTNFTSDEYIRVVKVGVSGNMTGPAYITNDFDYRSSYYRKTTDTIILDGRTSITNYSYAGSFFLPPITIDIFNSDDVLTTTRYAYPASGVTGSDAAVIDTLIAQNRIHMPLRTIINVDGQYVSGSRSLYRFFDSNGNRTTNNSGLGPYVGDVQAFEAQTYSNTINNNYWNTLGTIERIDTQTRKPHIVHQRGWTLRDTFVWDATHALLLERHFGIFDWQNEYHAGTRLLKKRTEPDGQYAQYFYDALQRLDSISVREGKVTTSYDYEYAGNSGQDHNRITTTIDFADPDEYASQSDLSQRITRQYFDGLGRPTQQIEQAYTTNDKDQVTITEYDSVSRPYKVYEPFESSQSNGDPFTGSTDTLDYTLTSFEESPLNRPYQVTPPDWYATTYGYGSNAASISILGTNYAAGTLKLDTITDPNGNQQITYTDIKGRLLQQKRLSSNGTTSIETRYQYDPEDRPITIVPPGSDLTDSGLIYTYQYDERDRVVEKNMPDQGAIDYVYDDRDLSTAMRDAVRRSEGKWIHTHYDEYGRAEATGFIQQGTISNGNTVYLFADSLSRTWYDGQGISESDSTFIGRVSRQRTRILGTNDYLDMRTWYDPYGRVEETLNNHIARLNDLSADRTTYEYDFADNILVANRDHRKPDGANLSITDEMNWDHAGRQVDHYLNIGGQRTHLSQQDYTAKDQLKEKDLGVSTSTSSSLQSLDYAYLANGFLRGINHVQTETNDWFKLGIHYDQPDGTTISGFTPQYNGNIGALSWQTGTGNEQVYRYAYDYLDRITSAQMTGNSYRTAYSYDQRGNLLTLDRYDANGTMIDDLSYIPYSGTNKIKNLFDGGTSAGFDEGDAPIFAAYTYDANGNLAHDPFKNLNIAYNHLNLPDTIIQPGSTNRIVWHYDAAGNKLRKEVLNDSIVLTGPFTENQYQARFITTDGQPTALDSTLLVAQDSIVFKPGFHAQAGMRLTAKIDSTIAPVDQTDYIGGIEYRNDDIQAIYHPVGRAVPSGSNCVFAGGYDEQCWRHEFVITDHLGNTRLRFSDLDGNTQIDSTEILDEITYYPFGSPWQDAGYRYTYNGKELDRELGLRWHHYGRRMFDPVIARFTGVDPISDQFAWVSTYNYAENEPIANIDLHGLQRTRYDVRLDVEAKQTINGEQSPAEFKAFLRAEGQGALVGISLVSPVDEVSLGLGLLSRTAVGRATSNFLSSAASRLTGLFRNSRKGIEEFADQALTRDEMAKIVGRGPSFPSASAYDFVPGEPVKKSVVEKLADDMKINGFDKTNPIETVELYGKKYILDGHHRVEAAKKAGADVYYKELSPEEAVKTFRFRDVEEIIWRAIEFNNK